MMTAAFAPYAHGAVTGTPMTVVQTTVDQVVAILNDKQAPREARQRRLLAAIAARFDFAAIARETMGEHWSTLTPVQQQQFVPLFTAFMEDAYLNKIEGYAGQQIDFTCQIERGPGDAQVCTSIAEGDRAPIKVDYRLRQEGTEWKIYDVIVDNVGITANYRNQFNHVIVHEGVDVLLREIQNKQQELQTALAS